MSRPRRVSGHEVVKILCNRFGFYVSGRSGSHVRLAKETPTGKIGCVVPMHPELKTGTLKGILRQAKISEEQYLAEL
ncbi:MAG TPA: hypothetical protein DCM05_09120 [Elusimicrobia bacterium]|nr:MAG: hypothetical protein A2293_11355 [Elusimicrobia bacterium RIFOXYB2_FULL_49_7]HAH06670.1 hypothetical protein [Elusimicrobiota bacterium]